MKTTSALFIITVTTILFFPKVNFAQAPTLGSAYNVVLFTITGAVGNTGLSQINGNIGTNTGAITGFEPPTTMAGIIDSGNAVTAQYAIDVQATYDQLFNTEATSTSHAPAFGSGETLFPGVYEIAAAGSVAGVLNLDGEGDPHAVFIFKFGGAFTTAASTTINLVNGATQCNVFWIADGAIAMAAVTEMKGTLIASNGAISMGAGGTLQGRMFSTTGAASIYAVAISVPGCSILPVQLLSFEGNCDKQNVVLTWRTATEMNNKYFTVERSIEGINWQMVGTVVSAGNSSVQHTYVLTDRSPDNKAFLYRLKQTDLDGNYTYANIIAVKKCGNEAITNLTIYPNSSSGKFELLFAGNTAQVKSIEIFNSSGQQLCKVIGFQSKFDLSTQAPGIYIMDVHLNSNDMALKIVVAK